MIPRRSAWIPPCRRGVDSPIALSPPRDLTPGFGDPEAESPAGNDARARAPCALFLRHAGLAQADVHGLLGKRAVGGIIGVGPAGPLARHRVDVRLELDRLGQRSTRL